MNDTELNGDRVTSTEEWTELDHGDKVDMIATVGTAHDRDQSMTVLARTVDDNTDDVLSMTVYVPDDDLWERLPDDERNPVVLIRDAKVRYHSENEVMVKDGAELTHIPEEDVEAGMSGVYVTEYKY